MNAKQTARTATVKFENVEGYFVAEMENGWVRVGLKGCECFDFPPSHEANREALHLTEETVEDFYDGAFGKYAAMCKAAGLSI